MSRGAGSQVLHTPFSLSLHRHWTWLMGQSDKWQNLNSLLHTQSRGERGQDRTSVPAKLQFLMAEGVYSFFFATGLR